MPIFVSRPARSRRRPVALAVLGVLGVLGVLALTLGCPAEREAHLPLVVDDAAIVKHAGGFLFTEGPAVDGEGNVFFSDIPNRRIHRWSVDGEISVFRAASGGANGLYFDRDGNLIACEMETRAITSTTPDGRVTILADEYDGKPLNMTNDLWIAPNGGIFFSDPYYGEDADSLEQGGYHVYYLPPDGSALVRVIDDLAQPNGVVGTPDGKTLYVADPGSEKTYAYAIQVDGTLGGRRVAADAGHDGLTRDERGNLYVADGVVKIYSSEGERISTIETPEAPANLTFGGPDRRTLFITARTGFYSIRMNVRGQ